jgi:hypothetical protein
MPAWTERLLILAVVVSHEAGNRWEQIGRALGVSRQSAHERYAAHVAGFHRDLAAVLDGIDAGKSVQDAIGDLQAHDFPAGRTLVVDTEWYAPKLDAWLAEAGPLPGGLNPAAQAGALLTTLSDPATSTGYRGGGARSADAGWAQCPFTAAFPAAEQPDEYLACILQQGHGGKHQLAVSGTE